MARLRQVTAIRKGTQAIFAGHVPARKSASAEPDAGRPSLVGCLAGEDPPQESSSSTCSLARLGVRGSSCGRVATYMQ